MAPSLIELSIVGAPGSRASKSRINWGALPSRTAPCRHPDLFRGSIGRAAAREESEAGPISGPNLSELVERNDLGGCRNVDVDERDVMDCVRVVGEKCGWTDVGVGEGRVRWRVWRREEGLHPSTPYE